MVDLNTNNHSLIHVMVSNNSNNLDDQQDIGCCTARRALQTTLRLALHGGIMTEIY